MPGLDPDPRTAPDDHEDATTVDNEGVENDGVSSEEPAEGADDEPAGSGDSPAG